MIVSHSGTTNIFIRLELKLADFVNYNMNVKNILIFPAVVISLNWLQIP
jgi:hypothetical protein